MSGSIKANKIKAKNVVSGVQVQGQVPEEVDKLKDVAAACTGRITANEIDAESIVSGLQVISDTKPASGEEFTEQLGVLNDMVKRLAAVASDAESKDVQEMGELLEKSQKELKTEAPSGTRISRWLKTVNEIASQVKTNVTTFTAVAKAAKSLAEVVASWF